MGHVHLRNLVVICQRELTFFGLEGVDVYRPIRGLGCDVFVERIPSDSLYVVIVLCDLADDIS